MAICYYIGLLNFNNLFLQTVEFGQWLLVACVGLLKGNKLSSRDKRYLQQAFLLNCMHF